jgi:hypothetical protein
VEEESTSLMGAKMIPDKQSKRSNLDQEGKRLVFKTAFHLINRYLDSGHFIGAYVLLFSIIEDRLNAMYAVRFFVSTNKQPPEFDASDAIHKIGFVDRVKKLRKEGDIEPKLAGELIERASDRNRKLHAALWRNTEFEGEDTLALKRQAYSIDKARKAQKKKLKK